MSATGHYRFRITPSWASRPHGDVDARHELKLPRHCRPVDALQGTGAIEGVQAAARPKRTWADDSLDALLEAIVVEPDDLGEPQRPAVALPAILEGTNQFVAAPDDPAPGPRRRQVYKDGIVPVRRPRTKQIRRRPQIKRIGVTAAVPHGSKHPPAALMLEERRVAGDDVGHERRLFDPPVREAFSPIQIDSTGGATLRHHPHFAGVLEHKRIRQVRAGIEDRPRCSKRPARVEFHHRNDRPVEAVFKILNKYK